MYSVMAKKKKVLRSSFACILTSGKVGLLKKQIPNAISDFFSISSLHSTLSLSHTHNHTLFRRSPPHLYQFPHSPPSQSHRLNIESTKSSHYTQQSLKSSVDLHTLRILRRNGFAGGRFSPHSNPNSGA